MMGQRGTWVMIPSQQVAYRESGWDVCLELSRFGLEAQATGSLYNQQVDVGCVTSCMTHQG